MNKSLSVLYAGSPDFSARVLDALLESAGKSFYVAGALTNPPGVRGRGKTLQPTAVAARAAQARIPVFAPEKLDSCAREKIAEVKPDMLVCYSYGKIFGPKFLALFGMGGINVHPSLLPKYRGAVPVPQAILNREQSTGVTVQKIALRMDSGNILAQKQIPLDGTETSESLLARLSDESVPLLKGVLESAYTAGALPEGKVQDESAASYCGKLQKEDGAIDWTQSAADIEAKIRAFTPWPGAFTSTADNAGELIYIRKVAVTAAVAPESSRADDSPAGTVLGAAEDGILVKTGDGILVLNIIQRQAKKALGWRDFLNGMPSFLSARFSSERIE